MFSCRKSLVAKVCHSCFAQDRVSNVANGYLEVFVHVVPGRVWKVAAVPPARTCLLAQKWLGHRSSIATGVCLLFFCAAQAPLFSFLLSRERNCKQLPVKCESYALCKLYQNVFTCSCHSHFLLSPKLYGARWFCLALFTFMSLKWALLCVAATFWVILSLYCVFCRGLLTFTICRTFEEEAPSSHRIGDFHWTLRVTAARPVLFALPTPKLGGSDDVPCWNEQSLSFAKRYRGSFVL